MDKIPERYPTKTGDRFLVAISQYCAPVIQLEMEFDYFIDEQRLAKSMELLMDAEPILGCRFRSSFFRPSWERVDKSRFEVFTLTNDKNEYDMFRNKPVDYLSEPQVSACLFRSDTADRLILKVSHIVTDAAGVKVLAALLSEIYNRLGHEPDFRPSPNLDDCRSYFQIIKHVPWYGYPQICFNFLKELINSTFPYKTHRIPVKDVTRAQGKYIIKHIGQEKVTGMEAYAKEHSATINDLLLSAIFSAHSKTGERVAGDALRIFMTIDLRRYVPDRDALSVSNFSSMEIIKYGMGGEENFESILKHVVKIMQKRKSSWLGLNPFAIGFPLIWALPFAILKRYYGKVAYLWYDTPNAVDMVTNMGEIKKESVHFGGYPTKAWLLAPEYDLPCALFGCSGYDGSLTFTASPQFDGDNTAIVNDFLDLVVSELSLEGVSQYAAAA